MLFFLSDVDVFSVDADGEGFLKREIKTLVYITITGGSNEKGGRPECDSGKKKCLKCDSGKC